MNFIKKMLITAFILSCTFFASASVAQSVSEYRIFSVLSDLPRFYIQDKDEDQVSRDIRLSRLAVSVDRAVQKHKPRGVSGRQMAAVLMTIAYMETRLAKNVGIGRCDLMPKGQQCDSGKAKTYFQLWEVACPAVWADGIVPGSQEELDIAASCAARLYTSAFNRCANKNPDGNWAGGFSGYRSIDCDWRPENAYQGPKARADYMNGVHYKLSVVPAKEETVVKKEEEKESSKPS